MNSTIEEHIELERALSLIAKSHLLRNVKSDLTKLCEFNYVTLEVKEQIYALLRSLDSK